jgi:hypothetical protein
MLVGNVQSMTETYGLDDEIVDILDNEIEPTA